MKARPSATPARVLYLAYWGALEPLGQSLVVPAVLRFAELGVEISLITFEKSEDLERTEVVRDLAERLSARGVRWHPLRYHKRPKWPATLFDALVAIVLSLRLRLSGRFDVVHARTFVAGPIGWFIARLLGARFVYHNEGFYPDEQVDAGVWALGSRVYQFAYGLETALYRHADGVVALSHASLPLIKQRRGNGAGLAVSPSVIDVDLFRARGAAPPDDAKAPLRFCYLGSLGGRYRVDDLMRFVAGVRERRATHLLVISRSEEALIHRAASEAGLGSDAYTVRSVARSEVPTLLASRQVGLHFLPKTVGTIGGSPTKIGEYWACGLPVVISAGMGDVDDIVRREGIGVVLNGEREPSTEGRACLEELGAILADPDLAARCRAAAARHYGLEVGVAAQLKLYDHLLGNGGAH
jgi:glycosyltransferase involved in cell wall biosynthesis